MSVATPDQTSEMRLLTDTELGEVNGGFIVWVLEGLFIAGMFAGGAIYDYMHDEGDVFGGFVTARGARGPERPL